MQQILKKYFVSTITAICLIAALFFIQANFPIFIFFLDI